MSLFLRTSLICFSLLLSSSSAWSAVYHVTGGGTKTSGVSTANDWTDANCYGDIQSAIAQISSGDEVIIDDGTYYIEDGNSINNYQAPIPNGTATTSFTIIRARNRLSVRIQNRGSLTYYDQIVRLGTSNKYIHIDGIIGVISNTNYPPTMFGLDGSYNKITNCIGVRKGEADNYTSVFDVSGNHNLVEHCAATGHGRYFFATGGTGSTDQYNIFRRNVCRFDYSDSNQPMACFNFYGDSTNGGHVFQNNIALDGHDPRQADEGNGTYSYVWGAWYFPKTTFDAVLQGNIALNNETTWGGYVLNEEDSYNLTTVDNVSWDNGIGFDPRGSGNGHVYSHWTIGSNSKAIGTSAEETTDEVSNSLFYSNTLIGASGWSTFDNNAFNPSAQETGTNSVASTDVIAYIPRIEKDSDYDGTASDGGDIGANVLFAYGAEGTFYGDTGWDLLQDGTNGQGMELLWPWPNEAAIRDAFAEANAPNAGATPATNDTTRGFAGKSGAYPLTTYVWEYLGNSIGDPATFDFTGYNLLPPKNFRVE